MKLNKKRKGFTLVELIVVIVILGILMLIGSMKYADVKDQANIAVVKTNHRTLVSALQLKMAQKQGGIPLTSDVKLKDLAPSIGIKDDGTSDKMKDAKYAYQGTATQGTLTSTYTKHSTTTGGTPAQFKIVTTLSDGVTTITGE